TADAQDQRNKDGAASKDQKDDKKDKDATPKDSKQIDKSTYVSPLATTGPKPEPITPPKPEEIAASIDRGVKFLLDDQNKDGSWGSAEKTKGLNIYAPPPGA